MPISARMSLWGLYKYDSTILDNLSVPAGMDSDNLKQNLLVETASLSVLYPDPAFMKTVIGLWSTERVDVWNKLYETTQLQYDPIENYDRIEEAVETTSGVAVTDSQQDRRVNNSDSRNQSGNSSSTNSNTSYNSNSFTDTAKVESSGQDQVSSVSTGQETATASGRESSNANRNLQSRIHGNIGVTTSQQMIEAQREVVQFCMTEFIINDFIQRFCVMVY